MILHPAWWPVFFLVALAYTMVGLGGGSSYVAFLALAGLPHTVIPSTALGLNLLATGVGFLFHRRNLPERAGWKLVGLYVLSMTGAYLGSQVELPARIFYLLLGGTLVGASLFSFARSRTPHSVPSPGSRRWGTVFPFAFAFGFLAALVGIGGGIFLSPVLLLSGFSARETAGITSLYIALNSFVGFAGHALAGRVHGSLLGGLALVVLAGSLTGSWLGSGKIPERQVRNALTLLIFAVGLRILWTGMHIQTWPWFGTEPE